MKIHITKPEDLKILKTWFTDKESCFLWAGSGFEYPYTDESFLRDILWGKIPTFSMKNSAGELVGFGQYYEKFNRCHLARLAISPSHRAQGLGTTLFTKIMEIGMSEISSNQCSLFVLDYNYKALKCYHSLGFKKQPYPPNHEYFENISFMVYKKQKKI